MIAAPSRYMSDVSRFLFSFCRATLYLAKFAQSSTLAATEFSVFRDFVHGRCDAAGAIPWPTPDSRIDGTRPFHRPLSCPGDPFGGATR